MEHTEKLRSEGEKLRSDEGEKLRSEGAEVEGVPQERSRLLERCVCVAIQRTQALVQAVVQAVAVAVAVAVVWRLLLLA